MAQRSEEHMTNNQHDGNRQEWLDVSGTGAGARVRTTIGVNDTYWDYFLLHKQAGEWKIGLKAFANPEPPG
jgi:hypothetical protein